MESCRKRVTRAAETRQSKEMMRRIQEISEVPGAYSNIPDRWPAATARRQPNFTGILQVTWGLTSGDIAAQLAAAGCRRSNERKKTTMRRRWLVLMVGAALGVAAVGAQAQDATPADKEKALAVLESSKKGVLEATKRLSEAQWNFKPAPEKWSVAAHSERHTKQIEEVKANENFPKK
jgi:hypothetical protein